MKYIKTLFALSTLALVGLASCSNGGNKTSTKTEESDTTCECSETVCPDVHVHEPGMGYVYNEDGHWHACSGCLDKSIRFDYESHEYEIKDGLRVCKVCGYSPDEENEKLFAKAVEGIKAFLSNEDKLTAKSLVSIKDEDGEMSMESEATFDFASGIAHQKSSYIAADGKASTASETHLGKTGDKYYYYSGRSSKTAQQTSADYIDYVYDNLMDGMLPSEYLEVVAECPSYGSVGETFLYMNGMEGNFSTEISEKEDVITYTILGTIYEVGETYLSEYVSELTFVIKDGFLSGLTANSVINYNYSGGTTDCESYSVTTTLEKGFDQELFDSYSTEGITESAPTSMEIKIYIDDYYFNRASVPYGTAYTNSYSDYGELYYDKECTKKYDGENITNYNTILYLKPAEVSPSEDYALVFRLTDITCYRGKYISPKEKKTANCTKVVNNNDYTFNWETHPDQAGQTITLDGVAQSSDTAFFHPEAGKVYTVINSYTIYYGGIA